MKVILSAILSILIITTYSFAQLGYIPLNADYASFEGTDDKSYTEIYLSFFQQDLQYELSDSTAMTKFSHTIEISKVDSLVFNITRNYQSNANVSASASNSQFIEVFPVELLPGDYKLKANVVDKISNKTGEYNLEINIPNFKDDFSVSNIEIATKIDTKFEDKSNFNLKNNISIYPNVSKTFTVFNPIVYFYFELYNLTSEPGNQYSYSYNISDTDDKVVREYKEKSNNVAGTSAAEVNGINVIALPNGAYFLNVNVTDKSTNKSVTQQKKFYVNKPKRQKSEKAIAAKIDGYEEYVNFTAEELDMEFNQVKYICKSEEIDIYEQMTDAESKKRFLSQFWSRRDPDPSTPLNEYKRIYFENLRIVNENYSTYFKEGWRTDRGRVLLIYGRPDEIERNPSTIDSQPYEIWHYYALEGGSKFVFADLSGNSNYELLHSTFRNEIKDPDWQLRIQKLKTRGYDPGIDRF